MWCSRPGYFIPNDESRGLYHSHFWIPEVQLLEVVPLVAAVSSEEALGVGLRVRGNEEVGYNATSFATALQVGAEHLTSQNGSSL